jgi:dethiobiotin synthetase
MSIYFITGIDTGIGKSFAAGLAARFLSRRENFVVTQKIVQTGVTGTIADDILLHRRLMEIEPLAEDLDGTTCSYLFKFPASPHLAAERENRMIDPARITSATKRLLEKFDIVLLEGAGGLFVPLQRNYLIADYVRELQYPVILVTSGRLGSINHTLLTFDAITHRNIPFAGIVFNRFPECDRVIQNDTLRLFRNTLAKLGRSDALVEMPKIDFGAIPDVDFSPIFS